MGDGTWPVRAAWPWSGLDDAAVTAAVGGARWTALTGPDVRVAVFGDMMVVRWPARARGVSVGGLDDGAGLPARLSQIGRDRGVVCAAAEWLTEWLIDWLADWLRSDVSASTESLRPVGRSDGTWSADG